MKILASALVLFAALNLSVGAPEFLVSDKGISIQAGAMGNFGVEAPILNTTKGEEKPAFSKTGDNTARFQYASGLQLDAEAKGTQLNFHFTKSTAEAKSFKITILIPMKYNQGGVYAFDASALKPLPLEKGGQFVQHGTAKTFTVIDPSNQGFTIETPGGYQGLQDNRNFGWAVFGYSYQFDVNGKSENWFNLAVKPAKGAGTAAGQTTVPAPAKALVDRYGQSTKVDYIWKVKTDEELKADGQKQQVEMSAFKADPAFDKYGGLAGSGAKYQLKKTGFFHVEKAAGRTVLVTPEGNVFFQLGVCGIASTDDYTTVKGREKVYEWLPDPKDASYLSAWRENKPDWGVFSFYIANWIRKFDRPFTLDEWTGQVVQRLRSWGFNSAGAFSANTPAMISAGFPNVSFLPLGKGGGIQMLPDKLGASEVMDPFGPGTEKILEEKFAKSIAPKAGDPLLIGYFLSNEPHWEELSKKLPTYKASEVAAKGKLVDMLQEKYKEIGQFNTAWNPAKPFADFAAMKEEPLFVRTEAGAADVQKFYELYLDTLFSMVERVFRKHDPNHLLIGSRLTPGTANNETAVKISGKYTDVVSINYYAYGVDAAFLKRASDWSGGKPIILSEWYYSSADTGLGSGKVRNQEERASAYRNYVEQSAALPFVVGLQWFIYGDQSITGRFFEGFHGEGNQTGLVDVADRPYAPLIAAAKESNSHIYDVMLGSRKAFAWDDPRFSGKGGKGGNKEVSVPKALANFKMDGSTTNWPGRPAEPIESNRLVYGTPNAKLRGDFRLCWDEQNLYFLIQVKDATPGMNTKDGDRLWSADGVELFIGARDTATGGSMIFSDRQILLGAGSEAKIHVADHPEESKLCSVWLIPEMSKDGYTLAVTIPWKILGAEPKAGMELLFDVAIDNSNDGMQREQQLAWNGTGQNSKDRAAWGRARISDN